MKSLLAILAFALLPLIMVDSATAQQNDTERDILVTFDNEGARAGSAGMSAPYRNRKRYSIAVTARRNADDVRDEYSLIEVDHWPIRSLSVYCFVYRVPLGEDRNTLINLLKSDDRVESVQPLQEFETSTIAPLDYDDTYAKLQHGLSILNISAAHRISQGRGVRVAIIDSDADSRHEDLKGRLGKIEIFASGRSGSDAEHGTAVASVIGANANNAVGIVGIAPQARLELFVACWVGDRTDNAICDSFTLAKALDRILEDPPDILNMSLTGPFDPLLERLLAAVQNVGVVVVAARRTELDSRSNFPASLATVIGVGNSEQRRPTSTAATLPSQDIFAPGNQIMVAVPNDSYDFRSGSSLAAAHVSGAIALLLAISPDLPFTAVLRLLRESQDVRSADVISINACVMLQLADPPQTCL